MKKKAELKAEAEAVKLMHEVALTEVDLCEDIVQMIRESSCTELEKQKLIAKAMQIRSTIASLTLRLDWKDDYVD